MLSQTKETILFLYSLFDGTKTIELATVRAASLADARELVRQHVYDQNALQGATLQFQPVPDIGHGRPYVLKGWIEFEYEGQGAVRLEAGSCVPSAAGDPPPRARIQSGPRDARSGPPSRLRHGRSPVGGGGQI